MNRREFIIKAGIVTAFSKTALISTSFAHSNDIQLNCAIDESQLPDVHPEVTDRFRQVLRWLEKNDWLSVINEVTGLEAKSADELWSKRLTVFTPDDTVLGFEDFSGVRLIEPGHPPRSLLYHVLASPLVMREDDPKTNHADFYPDLTQLDDLENYIYALQRLHAENIDTRNMVVAVFAYEYRPASKTLHECHADLVFSRTGFARIGNAPPAPYDKVGRCFSNKPEGDDPRLISVTPARYGVFLAERVNYKRDHEKKFRVGYEILDDKKDRYDFVVPIRKLFRHDMLLDDLDVEFTESHLNEKLQRLVLAPGSGEMFPASANNSKPPFVRRSSSNTIPDARHKLDDSTLVVLKKIGSSVLLYSKETPRLVWPAEWDNGISKERISLKIPPKSRKVTATNRRYTSFKLLDYEAQTLDAWDGFRLKVSHPNKIITNYRQPRNTPMFFNIRERIDRDGKVKVLGTGMKNLEDEIAVSYHAGLFEDSICDGCISIVIGPGSEARSEIAKKILNLPVMPAYSVVTAPDFFPLVDSGELDHLKSMFF